MGLIKKAFGFIVSPSHSRTMALVGMLVMVSAVSLTVVVSQQQQTLKQRATGPTLTTCNPPYTPPLVGCFTTNDSRYDSKKCGGSCTTTSGDSGSYCYSDSKVGKNCNTGSGDGICDIYGDCNVSSGGKPTCNSGPIECTGTCEPRNLNTCSANNGTRSSCNYTTYNTVPGLSCAPAPAGDQSCDAGDNCTSGYSCSSNPRTVGSTCIVATGPALTINNDNLNSISANGTLNFSFVGFQPNARVKIKIDDTVLEGGTLADQNGSGINKIYELGGTLPAGIHNLSVSSDTQFSNKASFTVVSSAPAAGDAPATDTGPTLKINPSEIDINGTLSFTFTGFKPGNEVKVSVNKYIFRIKADLAGTGSKSSPVKGTGILSTGDYILKASDDLDFDRAATAEFTVISSASCAKTGNVCTGKNGTFTDPASCSNNEFSAYACDSTTGNCVSNIIKSCDQGTTCTVNSGTATCKPAPACNVANAATACTPIPACKKATCPSGTCTYVANTTLDGNSCTEEGKTGKCDAKGTCVTDSTTATLAMTLSTQDVAQTSADITADLTLVSSNAIDAPITDAITTPHQSFTKTNDTSRRKYSASGRPITTSRLVSGTKYIIIAKKDNLIAKSSFTFSGQTPITATPATLVFGALSNDNEIDILDWNIFKPCWINKVATGDCASSDYNKNGTIDPGDFNALMQGWKISRDEGKNL